MDDLMNNEHGAIREKPQSSVASLPDTAHRSPSTDHTAKPWFKEPWPWILMSGPAIVVVAGVITMWLAYVSTDGLVADDYYKRGLAINQELQRDQAAADRGLAAEMDARDGLLRVRLTGRNADPEALFALMVHGTRAGLDERLRLARVGPGLYQGALPELPRGRWTVILEDPRRQWRIVKEGL
jgi:hypothetical protein